MRLFLFARLLAALALVLIAGLGVQANLVLEMRGLSDGVMSSDGKTLIVTVTDKAQLIYIDTVTEKKIKEVEVDFQPTLIARQGDRLFVAKKGAATLYELEAATGKEKKAIKIPGEPLQALGCHPEKGMIYAVNTNHEVFSIDPNKYEVTKTKARGQMLAIDPSKDAKYIYTGIQKAIQEKLVVTEGPGKTAMLSLVTTGQRALMVKYEIDGKELKAVAANTNAAINGKSMAVTNDGKRVAMAGGSGWRSLTERKANYAIVAFETSDLKEMSGQFDTGAFPQVITFHPHLPMAIALRGGDNEIMVFNAKSYAKKSGVKVKTTDFRDPKILIGGKGEKVVFISPTGQFFRKESTTGVEIFPLELTDKDKEILKNAYPK